MKERTRQHGPSESGTRHDHGRERHGRMRHGDVKAALLLALVEGPAHGYELGQRLLRASNGAWQPSPGSIYPTLQLLADEELVSSEERDQKRIYTLSRRGQAAVKERSDRGEGAPWESAQGGHSGPLREAVMALKMAAKQIATVGSADQREQALTILVAARRSLYDLLAKG